MRREDEAVSLPNMGDDETIVTAAPRPLDPLRPSRRSADTARAASRARGVAARARRARYAADETADDDEPGRAVASAAPSASCEER